MKQSHKEGNELDLPHNAPSEDLVDGDVQLLIGADEKRN